MSDGTMDFSIPIPSRDWSHGLAQRTHVTGDHAHTFEKRIRKYAEAIVAGEPEGAINYAHFTLTYSYVFGHERAAEVLSACGAWLAFHIADLTGTWRDEPT